jgi:hypothetical protein
MAQKASAERKRNALFRLKDRLARALSSTASTAQRHELIFEIWDEIDDGADGPERGGAAARATILAFIRRTFPPGGPDAYSADAILALNRRRYSRDPFDPYGTLPAAAK